VKRPNKIAFNEYRKTLAANRHVFLVGNLKELTEYPFIQDSRFEFIVCQDAPGDHGRFHWHAEVDEYEIVIEGRIGYYFVEKAQTIWYSSGDFSHIQAGCCVRRIVNETARTIAIKVPSSAEKRHCSDCDRECGDRQSPYVNIERDNFRDGENC